MPAMIKRSLATANQTGKQPAWGTPKKQQGDDLPQVTQPAAGGGTAEMNETNDERRTMDDEAVEGTPLDRQSGYTKQPTRFQFDVDLSLERGIGETYEYCADVAKSHILHEFDGRQSPHGFAKVQGDVKPRMRTILFAWLVDVHRKFTLNDEVLWRTFEILDRYLAVKKESRKQLQLLACAALWIASKYHEIYPPTADDFVTVSDKAFTKDALIKTELKLCRFFGMQFTYPTAFNFLTRYTQIALSKLKVSPDKLEKVQKRIKYLSLYGMERMIMEIRALNYKPSLLAACSLFTAMTLLSYQWSDEMEQATGFSADDFREKYELYRRIKHHVMDFTSKNHNAVIRKYATPERGEVSSLRKKANPPPKRTNSQRSPEEMRGQISEGPSASRPNLRRVRSKRA